NAIAPCVRQAGIELAPWVLRAASTGFAHAGCCTARSRANNASRGETTVFSADRLLPNSHCGSCIDEGGAIKVDNAVRIRVLKLQSIVAVKIPMGCYSDEQTHNEIESL